jgi:hypothetical protein
MKMALERECLPLSKKIVFSQIYKNKSCEASVRDPINGVGVGPFNEGIRLNFTSFW